MDLESIRRVTIKSSIEGDEQTVAGLKNIATAQSAIVGTSEQTARATLSVESAYQRLVQQVDPAARSSAKLEAAMKTLNAALAQGVISQAEYGQRVEQINAKFTTASGFAAAYSKSIQGIQSQMIALSAGLGPVGAVLSSFGPIGLVAAAGFGAVSNAFGSVSDQAQRMGERAVGIRTFSDVTGLTVEQLRALGKAGAEVGVTGDTMKTSIERFSVSMDDAHLATGSLYDQVKRIDGGLADQLSQAKSSAQGLDILAQAYVEADTAQKNALSRTAFGRGGIEVGQALNIVNEKGGIDAMVASMDRFGGLTREQVDEWAKMSIAIEESKKRVDAFVGAMVTGPILQMEAEWAKLNELSIKSAFKGPGGTTGLSGLVLNATLASINAGVPSYDQSSKDASSASTESAAATKEAAQAQEQLSQSTGRTVQDITREINTLKTHSAALGQAVTASDQLKIKQDEIEVAFKSNVISLDEYNAALRRASDQGKVADFQQQVAQDTLNVEVRRVAVVQELQQAYGGVSAQVATTLSSLDDQFNKASAVTGAEQLQAQEEATINALLREGYSLQDAISISVAQTQNSEAQIDSSIERQVNSLKQQTELIRARQNGNEAQVAAEQAYKNAIDAGASSTEASALSSATLENYMARAAASSQGFASNMGSAAQSISAAAQGMNDVEKSLSKSSDNWSPSNGGAIGHVQIAPLSSGPISVSSDTLTGIINKALSSGLGLGGAAQTILDLYSGHSGPSGFLMPKGLNDTAVQALTTLTGMMTSSGDTAGATSFLQSALANLKQQPETLARDQLISQLNDQLKQLTDATNQNTDATKSVAVGLDSIYSGGHSALAIGYYAEGEKNYNYDPNGFFKGGANYTAPSQPYDPNAGYQAPGSSASTSTTTPVTGTVVNPAAYGSLSYPDLIRSLGLGSTPGPQYESLGIPHYADGGVIEPNSLAYVGEHGPNPRLIQTGNKPITVTPGVPDTTKTSDAAQTIINQTFVFNTKSNDLGDRRTRRQLADGYGNSFRAMVAV